MKTNQHFYLGGQQFKFVGANYYPLLWSSQATVQAILDAARLKGITVIRAWCFDSGKPPTDSAGNFRFLDYPLGDNLITNGEFETNTTGWTLHAEFTRDNTFAKTGTYSIKQVSPSAYNGMETDLIDVTASTDYTFTFWYKQTSRSGFGPLLVIKKEDGTTLLDGGLLEGSTGEWVRKQVNFSSGAQTKISIRIQNFNGSVTMYYDTFNLSVKQAPVLADREATFANLDMVLDEARTKGIKVMLCLADNNPNYDTKRTYVDWANTLYGAGLSAGYPNLGFFTSQYCQQLYKDFIHTLANRVNTINGLTYKNDPSIFAWELGNELRIDRDDPAGGNTLNSTNLHVISYPHVDTDNGVNILPNISFETDTTGWSLDSGVTRTSEDAKDGTYSIKSVQASGYNALRTAQLTVTPFMTYSLSFWHNTTVNSGNPPVVFIGTTSGNNDIKDGGYADATSGQWVQKTVTFNAGLNTTLYIAMQNWGGDTVSYYDSFDLKTVPNYDGWADIMSTYIKSQDPNHLVTFGAMSHHWKWVEGDSVANGTYYGVDYNLLTKLPNIDFLDVHVYPTQVSGAGQIQKYGQHLGYPNAISGDGFRAQLKDYIDVGHANGKPVIIGEIGMVKEVAPDTTYYPLYPRHTAFQNYFADFFDLADGGDGILLWSIVGGTGGGTYSINLGDTGGEESTDNTNDTILVGFINTRNNTFQTKILSPVLAKRNLIT